jgi:hypothetical protein
LNFKKFPKQCCTSINRTIANDFGFHLVFWWRFHSTSRQNQIRIIFFRFLLIEILKFELFLLLPTSLIYFFLTVIMEIRFVENKK